MQPRSRPSKSEPRRSTWPRLNFCKQTGCGSSWVPGLATSVYAASEGLSVLVLDCRSSGGQAGASARIENYLGFPTGISGMALMARAYNQAHKFGVETTIPSEVVGLDTPDANKPGRFVLRSRAATWCRRVRSPRTPRRPKSQGPAPTMSRSPKRTHISGRAKLNSQTLVVVNDFYSGLILLMENLT